MSLTSSGRTKECVLAALLATLFISCWTICPAEQLPIQSFTTAHGLARDYINRIKQDSRGFIWSDRIWLGNTADWRAIGYSLLGYGFGVGCWIFAVKYLKQVGGMSVSTQATGWFLLTIIGVALVNGDFIKWAWVDKALAVACITCFAVLVYRTSSL